MLSDASCFRLPPQAAVASSQRYDADAYAPLHASLARAARIADESAAMAVTGRVTAAAPEPGAGEGAAASGSVTSDVVGALSACKLPAQLPRSGAHVRSTC